MLAWKAPPLQLLHTILFIYRRVVYLALVFVLISSYYSKTKNVSRVHTRLLLIVNRLIEALKATFWPSFSTKETMMIHKERNKNGLTAAVLRTDKTRCKYAIILSLLLRNDPKNDVLTALLLRL